MNRNIIFLLFGIVIAGCAFAGYKIYQDRQTSAVEINVGKSGLSIQSK